LTIYAHPRLFKLAFGILRDAELAEDATQQTFIDIWRFLRRLGDHARLDSCWYRMLIGVCRAKDKERGDDEEVAEPILAGDPTAPDPFGIVIDRQQLSRGFGELSVDDRALLVLRYLANLSVEDLAVALDIAPGKVDARLEAALDALDSTLAGDTTANAELAPQGEAA
jgi:RNA polymerase sigma-70 factor (ECF subfamily)